MAAPNHQLELTGAYADLETLLRLRHLKLIKRKRPPLSRAAQVGTRLSRLRGRGIDFAEVRAYHPGDDVRNIDWRVTARKAKPHTKIYREERERPTMIVVDQTQRMFFGTRIRLKSVAAAEAAALLGWQALSSGDRVGGIVFDNEREHVFRPYRNARTMVRFLSRLSQSNRRLSALTPVSAQNHLAMALDHMRALSPVGWRIFLVGDFSAFEPRDEPLLIGLARHNTVVCLPVTDPMEYELPPPGNYVVCDPAGRLDLDAGSRRTREAYRSAFDMQRERVRGACQRAGIQHLEISTALPIVDQLSTRLAP